MIANASVARFDGLFTSSERSIHIAGIRTQHGTFEILRVNGAPTRLLWQFRSLARDHLPALRTFLPYVQDVDVRDVRRGMHKVRFAGD
jgi:hypothetical protein